MSGDKADQMRVRFGSREAMGDLKKKLDEQLAKQEDADMADDKASQGDRPTQKLPPCPTCGQDRGLTHCLENVESIVANQHRKLGDLRRQLHASQQAVGQAKEENERLRAIVDGLCKATSPSVQMELLREAAELAQGGAAKNKENDDGTVQR